MQNKKAYIYLLIIAFFALFLRLYFTLQNPHFSSDEAYFNIRHTQYILDNFKPMTYDDLSYSGRNVPYPPLFHYLLALFSLVIPITIVGKILPALLAFTIPIVVYFISFELTKDNISSLFSSLFSSFLPILMTKTLNSISVFNLVLPLSLLMIYCLIKLREERTYLAYFVFLSILLPLTHSSSFLLLLSLIIYALILVSENFVVRRTLKEAIIFAALSILFIQFFIFKSAFLQNGISILFRLQPYISVNSSGSFGLTQILYSLGILPAILGGIAVLLITFTSRKDSHILMVSILFSTLLIMLLKNIDFTDGLLFLAIILSILSSISLSRFLSYFRVTKFESKKKYFIYSLLFLSVVLLIIPSVLLAKSIMKEVPSDIDVGALSWIGYNIEGDVVIAALPEEGNLISYMTGKKNVADTYSILAPDANDRLQALSRLYQSGSEFEVLDIAQKYNIDFIFVSEKAKMQYNIDDLKYSGNKRCFDRRKYEDFSKIYQVRRC